MKVKKNEGLANLWKLIWDMKWLILVGIVLIAICASYLNSQMNAELKRFEETDEYRLALDYLQSQPFIEEKYGTEPPKLMSRTYQNYNLPESYIVTFAYNYVPVLNWGDYYEVELHRIDGEWVVVGIVD